MRAGVRGANKGVEVNPPGADRVSASWSYRQRSRWHWAYAGSYHARPLKEEEEEEGGTAAP